MNYTEAAEILQKICKEFNTTIIMTKAPDPIKKKVTKDNITLSDVVSVSERAYDDYIRPPIFHADAAIKINPTGKIRVLKDRKSEFESFGPVECTVVKNKKTDGDIKTPVVMLDYSMFDIYNS